MSDTPRSDCVICPGCCHQFVAVPIDVQREHAALRAELDRRVDLASENADLRQRKAEVERESAALRATLRGLKATFDTIHDRHCDEADCDEDASGHRTPNRDMHTMVDCNVALGEIDKALKTEQSSQDTQEPRT